MSADYFGVAGAEGVKKMENYSRVAHLHGIWSTTPVRWTVGICSSVLTVATARDELTTQHWHVRGVLSMLPFSWATWAAICLFIVPLVVFEASYSLQSRAKEVHEIQITALGSAAQKIAEDEAQVRLARIVELEEAVSRKHPHDEHLERSVSGAMTRLDEQDQRFIRWLLDVGRVTRARIQGEGFRGIQEDINRKAGIDLITHDLIRNSLGNEIDREHQINPAYSNALRNILYPSPPGTPPAA